MISIIYLCIVQLLNKKFDIQKQLFCLKNEMRANKIFFNEINIFNFPLMILFAIFGFKVYFLKSSFFLKVEKFQIILDI